MATTEVYFNGPRAKEFLTNKKGVPAAVAKNVFHLGSFTDSESTRNTPVGPMTVSYSLVGNNRGVVLEGPVLKGRGTKARRTVHVVNDGDYKGIGWQQLGSGVDLFVITDALASDFKTTS